MLRLGSSRAFRKGTGASPRAAALPWLANKVAVAVALLLPLMPLILLLAAAGCARGLVCWLLGLRAVCCCLPGAAGQRMPGAE